MAAGCSLVAGRTDGKSGTAEGNGSGNGTGNGGGSGQGKGSGQGSGSGAGHGTTNEDAGSGGRAGASTANRPTEPATGMTAEYERIYLPTRLNTDGQASHVDGQSGQGASQEVMVDGSPVSAGMLVPYQQVVGHYTKQARESLEREPLPAYYAEIVKQYFSELE